MEYKLSQSQFFEPMNEQAQIPVMLESLDETQLESISGGPLTLDLDGDGKTGNSTRQGGGFYYASNSEI